MWDCLAAPSETIPTFLAVSGLIAACMLIWNTVEVGRNDATNLINAVFGARILSRWGAICVAGLGVVLGAIASSEVIETARKGIFKPSMLPLEKAVAVYIAVYIVGTIMLYGYSAFGVPVSTTATLVFSLLGAAFAVGGPEIVYWGKAGEVISAIVFSIFISGVAGFLIQRAVRGALRDRSRQLAALLLHGGWVGGGMLTGLCYFMLVKGMRNITFVRDFSQALQESAYGTGTVVLGLWAFFSIVIHMLLVIFRKRAAKWLFPGLAIIGTFCMGFAFGQNDLANCASPGLAVFTLIKYAQEGVRVATEIPISRYMLAVCGLLLLTGMMTKNAARVTRAQVYAGSMAHNVALWAPWWCIWLARLLLRFRGEGPSLAPPAALTNAAKTMHYDAIRACTILAVSASVIATASGLGLPVSTTYVAFAAVIATGAADRIMQRGDADLKFARMIWVIFSWFAAAAIAMGAGAVVCKIVFTFGVSGIAIGLAVNLTLRYVFKKRGDAQEKRTREQAYDRVHPERLTEYDE